MRGRGPGLLCERQHELEVALTAVTEAAGGDGRVLVVEGPPGIGKTRLLEAIAEVAARDGFEVHRACGDDLESGFAYGVLRQLLAPCLARLDPSVRAVVLEGPASVVASIVEGTDDHRTAGLDDEALAAAHGLYRLMQDLADRQPRLLCVDDAHWADVPSLHALGFVARRLGGLPVVVLFACGATSNDRVGDLLGRFQSVSAARRLTLGPLSEEAVAALAGAALQGEPEPDFCRRLWHSTGGNPFLVHELLAALSAGEPAWGQFDTSDVERLVPDPVAQFVLGRVAAAGETASQLADAVAVFGEVTLYDAATLASLGELEAVQAADRLVAADILTPGPCLRFAHPILRHAIRAHIPPARRSLAHAHAARLLADRGALLEQIAAQLLEALPRADPWVVETLLAAAARERQRGSPETAVSLLTRALAEPPPPNLRQRVTLALAKAQTHSGHPQAVATARQALAGAAGPAEEAAAALQLVRTLGLTGDIWSALDLLHQRTADGSGLDPELALQLEADLLGVARLHPPTRDEALARLDRLAPLAPPPRSASAVLLANLALSALERNEHPAKVAELAQMALASGWPVEDMSFQLVYAFETLTWVDRFDEAERACNSAVAAAQDRGSLTLSALAHGWRSVLNLRRGAVPDAEADARISYELIAGAAPSGRTPFARAKLADALMVRGELEEAKRVLADPEPAERAEENPFYLDSRGRLRFAQGDPPAALEDLLDCGQALARRGGVDVPAMFPWRSQAALALLRMGDHRRAQGLATEELTLATKGQVPGAIAEALIAIGLIEGGDDGIHRLHSALETLEDSPRVLTRIHALTELGSMLRRNRQLRAARGFLASALDLAYRHGATALADRAREELTIAGGRPRRAAKTGLDALTPSERRVAQLVAQGLTNRQIASSLFVSSRTVATHLTHIYQKLGMANRAELSTLLADNA
ncbi:MAG TPA: AAA family ATPase [Actinomycetes bacterium]|nr:AAA family ATPase [Actinomycetes bacterium]